VVVAGRSISRCQRPGKPARPPIEEALNICGVQAIADLLEPFRVETREKAVVERLKGDSFPAELLLDPLVTVKTELDGVRDVGPDLQEARPPFPVLKVEVEVLDANRLGREVESHRPLGGRSLGRLEGTSLLLGYPDEDHPLWTVEPGAMLVGDIVLALPTLEVNHRGPVALSVLLYPRHETIMDGPENGGRRDRLPKMVTHEEAQLPGHLKRGDVPVDVDSIDTADRQGDVVADNLVNVGHLELLC